MKKIWLFPNALFQKQTFVFKWIHSRSDLSAPKRLSSMVYKQTSVWPTDMLIISAQNFIKRLGSLLSCMKVDSRGCSRHTLLLKKKSKKWPHYQKMIRRIHSWMWVIFSQLTPSHGCMSIRWLLGEWSVHPGRFSSSSWCLSGWQVEPRAEEVRGFTELEQIEVGGS